MTNTESSRLGARRVCLEPDFYLLNLLPPLSTDIHILKYFLPLSPAPPFAHYQVGPDISLAPTKKMAPGATGPKRVTTGNDDSSQAKKRKLGPPSSSNGQTRAERIAKLAPKKSSFEGDLEKLSQGITELKGGPLCLLRARYFLYII